MLAVVSSIATSVLAYSTLPGRMRIYWSLGGPYYGPEFASTLIVTVAFPLLVAGFYGGGRWLRAYLERSTAFDAIRLLYDGAILLALTGVLVFQSVLVWGQPRVSHSANCSRQLPSPSYDSPFDRGK